MSTAGETDFDTPALALLWAARETGLLTALLREAGDASDAAESAGVTPRSARLVADALVELGILRRVDGGLEPTNRALGLLATRDLRSVGQLPAALDQFGTYVSLPETMRGAEPPAAPDDGLRHQLGAAESVDDTTVEAIIDAVLAANPDAERALTVADGPGRHARELTARGLDVTLLDGPAEVEAVEPLLRGTDITVERGSLANIEPKTFDLVVLVDGAWRQSPAENRFTISAATETLAPGGAVVVVEPLRDRSTATVTVAAAALAAGIGQPYTEDEVTDWLTDAGLTEIETSDVPESPYQAITGRRQG